MIGDRVALGDVCEVSWGDTKTTKSAYVDNGYPAFSASGQDGFLPHFDHEGPGIVLSAIGAQCGKTWFVDGQWSCIKNTMYLKSSKADVDIKYVYYATQNPTIWPRRGAAQPFISLADAKRIEIHLPPLGVQRSVVVIISAYDDLIDNNRRRIALLEQSARLLYREWFVHLRFPGHEHVQVVDGVPEGWERKRLVELSEMTMGQSPASEHYNDDGFGFPFHQGVTNFGARYVEHQTWCDIPGRMAQPGDILFSVRAPVGRLNLTLDQMVIGRGLAALRSREGQQSMLFYQLANHFFKEDMIGGGAIFASVTKKDVENQRILQPTPQLAGEFDDFASDIDRQIQNLVIQNDKLRQARDLLLPRLMRGEIEI